MATGAFKYSIADLFLILIEYSLQDTCNKIIEPPGSLRSRFPTIIAIAEHTRSVHTPGERHRKTQRKQSFDESPLT